MVDNMKKLFRVDICPNWNWGITHRIYAYGESEEELKDEYMRKYNTPIVFVNKVKEIENG